MSLTNDDLLAISELMDAKFDEKLQPIKEDISVLKEDVSVLKDKVGNLEQDVRILKLDNENNIMPKIQVLLDNYVPAARQFEDERARLNTIQTDVDVMKIVVENHSEKLQRLAG